MDLKYLYGLHNHLETEAEPNVILKGRNSPQKVPYGLYTEQLSGSAFTCQRAHNLRTWLYRIRPSVLHGEFTPYTQKWLLSTPFCADETPPTQCRWNPLPYPKEPTDFIDGLITLAGHGSIDAHSGAAIHLYAITASMTRYFYNADGELLVVPQEGTLLFKTELGHFKLNPGEIGVIPRGIKFQVELLDPRARGYVCENYGAPLRLPDLGLIGANGLASARDFAIPTARYENKRGDFTLLCKFQGNLWQAPIGHSPLDVVGWHGNYTPYCYDLRHFNTVNTVSFDHPDPSIFTVLTSPSEMPNIANIDFVIFPPRWMVATDTFRPPYYHRNIMSEYMGLIHGQYDAKGQGFVPGGGSLHNCMSAHGPDASAYEDAVASNLQPEYYENTLAFMFESRSVWKLTVYANSASIKQENYLDCWQRLKANFSAKGIQPNTEASHYGKETV